jgi:hypothetical protein
MNIHQGINPTKTHTTAQYPLGLEAMDPRGGSRSGNRIRYVRADAAVAQYDAVQMKMDETDAPHAIIPTAATTDLVAGIAEIAFAANDYGWITVHGFVPIANVADASAQGDVLGASGTAGRLTTPTFTTTAATLAQLNAGVRAAMRGIVAQTDGSAGNQAAVFIMT